MAIEFRSYSKTAGFTGLRCAYTVVPKECMAWDDSGQRVALHALWMRRHTTKFNGVSYPVQRAAEAVYSAEGQQQVRALIDGYLDNARTIRRAFEAMGFACTGRYGPTSGLMRSAMPGRFSTSLHRAGVVSHAGRGLWPLRPAACAHQRLQ